MIVTLPPLSQCSDKVSKGTNNNNNNKSKNGLINQFTAWLMIDKKLV